MPAFIHFGDRLTVKADYIKAVSAEYSNSTCVLMCALVNGEVIKIEDLTQEGGEKMMADVQRQMDGGAK